MIRSARRPMIDPRTPTARYSPPSVVDQLSAARWLGLIANPSCSACVLHQVARPPPEGPREAQRVRGADHRGARVPQEPPDREQERRIGRLGRTRRHQDHQPIEVAGRQFFQFGDEIEVVGGRLITQSLAALPPPRRGAHRADGWDCVGVRWGPGGGWGWVGTARWVGDFQIGNLTHNGVFGQLVSRAAVPYLSAGAGPGDRILSACPERHAPAPAPGRSAADHTGMCQQDREIS